MKGIFIRALETTTKINIMYIDQNEQITKRTVKVLKMNHETILVYCYLRKKLRTLHFNQVLSAAPIKTQYSA